VGIIALQPPGKPGFVRRELRYMTNRPARITEVEIARAIRAARKAGSTEVELKLGDQASIRIPLAPEKPVAESEEVVL
jgi:hypothetical protein